MIEWPSLQPGEYLVAITTETHADAVGFQALRLGLEVRDVIMSQLPGGIVSVAFLLRQDPEASVVERIVRSGTGAVDIDGSRVAYASESDEDNARVPQPAFNSDTGKIYNYKTGEGRSGDVFDPSNGRWPANFIFVHGPDCECVGEKQVKPTNGSGKASVNSGTIGSHGIYGTMNVHRSEDSSSYVSSDGTETVPDWNCQPNCPVALVDAQSGFLKSPAPYVKATSTYNRVAFGKGIGQAAGEVVKGFGDDGGASRFFKHVKSLDLLVDYLHNMIRSEYVLHDEETAKGNDD